MKNPAKKAFLGTFWKVLTEKSRSSLKIGIYLTIFSFRRQIWTSHNSTKGGPFGLLGGQIPELQKLDFMVKIF